MATLQAGRPENAALAKASGINVDMILYTDYLVVRHKGVPYKTSTDRFDTSHIIRLTDITRIEQEDSLSNGLHQLAINEKDDDATFVIYSEIEHTHVTELLKMIAERLRREVAS